MTRRRLGIVILALAAVWSLAGLESLIFSSETPTSPTWADTWSVPTAYASVEGDPDDLGSPDGDPDDLGTSPPDTTITPSPDSGYESKSLLQRIAQLFGSLFGGK